MACKSADVSISSKPCRSIGGSSAVATLGATDVPMRTTSGTAMERNERGEKRKNSAAAAGGGGCAKGMGHSSLKCAGAEWNAEEEVYLERHKLRELTTLWFQQIASERRDDPFSHLMELVCVHIGTELQQNDSDNVGQRDVLCTRGLSHNRGEEPSSALPRLILPQSREFSTEFNNRAEEHGTQGSGPKCHVLDNAKGTGSKEHRSLSISPFTRGDGEVGGMWSAKDSVATDDDDPASLEPVPHSSKRKDYLTGGRLAFSNRRETCTGLSGICNEPSVTEELSNSFAEGKGQKGAIVGSLSSHSDSSRHGYERCRRCQALVEKKKRYQHHVHCNRVPCTYCGEMVLRRSLEDCPKKMYEVAEQLLLSEQLYPTQYTITDDVRLSTKTVASTSVEDRNMGDGGIEYSQAQKSRFINPEQLPALGWLQRAWRSRLSVDKYEQFVFHCVWKRIDDVREKHVALLNRNDSIWEDTVRNPIRLSTTSLQLSSSRRGSRSNEPSRTASRMEESDAVVVVADDASEGKPQCSRAQCTLAADSLQSPSSSPSSSPSVQSSMASDGAGKGFFSQGTTHSLVATAAKKAVPTFENASARLHISGVTTDVAEQTGAGSARLQKKVRRTAAARPITYTRQWITRFLDGMSKSEPVDLQTAKRLTRDATTLLKKRPLVQDVQSATDGDVFVVGDLHGQIKDLRHILSLMKSLPNEKLFIVFNGDFVDRGKRSYEVLLTVFALLLTFPLFVFLNRGNHEDLKTNIEYGFQAELVGKFGGPSAKKLLKLIVTCYESMPLIVVLNRRVLVVHGGLPRNPVPLARIQQMRRVRHIPSEEQRDEDEQLLVDLLWSDPVEQYRSRQLGQRHQGKYWRTSKRGCGVEYLSTVTQEFLRINDLKLVVRSHEVVHGGYAFVHKNRCCTVFSASDYGGVSRNRGAVAVFSNGSSQPIFYTWFLREDSMNMLTDFADVMDFRVLTQLIGEASDKSQARSGAGDPLVAEAATDSKMMSPPLPSSRRDSSGSVSSDTSLNNLAIEANVLADVAPMLIGKLNTLRAVNELIYSDRSALLANFVLEDVARTGLITEDEWADVLRARLGVDLPWLCLRSYLVPTTRIRGMIQVPYAVFLRGVRSMCAENHKKQWQEYILRRVFDSMDIPDDLLPDEDDMLQQSQLPAAPQRQASHFASTDNVAMLADTWQLEFNGNTRRSHSQSLLVPQLLTKANRNINSDVSAENVHGQGSSNCYNGSEHVSPAGPHLATPCASSFTLPKRSSTCESATTALRQANPNPSGTHTDLLTVSPNVSPLVLGACGGVPFHVNRETNSGSVPIVKQFEKACALLGAGSNNIARGFDICPVETLVVSTATPASASTIQRGTDCSSNHLALCGPAALAPFSEESTMMQGATPAVTFIPTSRIESFSLATSQPPRSPFVSSATLALPRNAQLNAGPFQQRGRSQQANMSSALVSSLFSPAGLSQSSRQTPPLQCIATLSKDGFMYTGGPQGVPLAPVSSYTGRGSFGGVGAANSTQRSFATNPFVPSVSTVTLDSRCASPLAASWWSVKYNYNELMQKLISKSTVAAQLSSSELYTFFEMLDDDADGHIVLGELVELIHALQEEEEEDERNALVITDDALANINMGITAPLKSESNAVKSSAPARREQDSLFSSSVTADEPSSAKSQTQPHLCQEIVGATVAPNVEPDTSSSIASSSDPAAPLLEDTNSVDSIHSSVSEKTVPDPLSAAIRVLNDGCAKRGLRQSDLLPKVAATEQKTTRHVEKESTGSGSEESEDRVRAMGLGRTKRSASVSDGARDGSLAEEACTSESSEGSSTDSSLLLMGSVEGETLLSFPSTKQNLLPVGDKRTEGRGPIPVSDGDYRTKMRADDVSSGGAVSAISSFLATTPSGQRSSGGMKVTKTASPKWKGCSNRSQLSVAVSGQWKTKSLRSAPVLSSPRTLSTSTGNVGSRNSIVSSESSVTLLRTSPGLLSERGGEDEKRLLVCSTKGPLRQHRPLTSHTVSLSSSLSSQRSSESLAFESDSMDDRLLNATRRTSKAQSPTASRSSTGSQSNRPMQTRSFGNLKALREAEASLSESAEKRRDSLDGPPTDSDKDADNGSPFDIDAEEGFDSPKLREADAGWMYPALMLLQDFVLLGPPHSLRTTFGAMDRDRDGQLDFNDFVLVFEYLNKKMVHPPSMKEYKRLFRRMCEESKQTVATSTTGSARTPLDSSVWCANSRWLGGRRTDSHSRSPTMPHIEPGIGRHTRRESAYSVSTRRFTSNMETVVSGSPSEQCENAQAPLKDLKMSLKEFVDYFAVSVRTFPRGRRYDGRGSSCDTWMDSHVLSPALVQADTKVSWAQNATSEQQAAASSQAILPADQTVSCASETSTTERGLQKPPLSSLRPLVLEGGESAPTAYQCSALGSPSIPITRSSASSILTLPMESVSSARRQRESSTPDCFNSTKGRREADNEESYPQSTPSLNSASHTSSHEKTVQASSSDVESTHPTLRENWLIAASGAAGKRASSKKAIVFDVDAGSAGKWTSPLKPSHSCGGGGGTILDSHAPSTLPNQSAPAPSLPSLSAQATCQLSTVHAIPCDTEVRSSAIQQAMEVDKMGKGSQVLASVQEMQRRLSTPQIPGPPSFPAGSTHNVDVLGANRIPSPLASELLLRECDRSTTSQSDGHDSASEDHREPVGSSLTDGHGKDKGGHAQRNIHASVAYRGAGCGGIGYKNPRGSQQVASGRSGSEKTGVASVDCAIQPRCPSGGLSPHLAINPPALSPAKKGAVGSRPTPPTTPSVGKKEHPATGRTPRKLRLLLEQDEIPVATKEGYAESTQSLALVGLAPSSPGVSSGPPLSTRSGDINRAVTFPMATRSATVSPKSPRTAKTPRSPDTIAGPPNHHHPKKFGSPNLRVAITAERGVPDESDGPAVKALRTYRTKASSAAVGFPTVNSLSTASSLYRRRAGGRRPSKRDHQWSARSSSDASQQPVFEKKEEVVQNSSCSSIPRAPKHKSGEAGTKGARSIVAAHTAGGAVVGIMVSTSTEPESASMASASASTASTSAAATTTTTATRASALPNVLRQDTMEKSNPMNPRSSSSRRSDRFPPSRQ